MKRKISKLDRIRGALIATGWLMGNQSEHWFHDLHPSVTMITDGCLKVQHRDEYPVSVSERSRLYTALMTIGDELARGRHRKGREALCRFVYLMTGEYPVSDAPVLNNVWEIQEKELEFV